MALEQKVHKLDQPIIFALTITLVVVGTIAVLSWLFMALGWTGPLSVLKGGFIQAQPTHSGQGG